MSQDKTGLLAAFLGGLPGHIAARLAKTVEMDRLLDGASLPHEALLACLRPLLRRDNPERTHTPLRLFCRPFQDTLSSLPRKAKQKASLARESVGPVWRWLGGTLLPDETARYVKEVKALILTQDEGAVLARAGQFWSQAAAAIAAAANDEKGARAALGGELILADAREIALLLAAAPAVLKIQELMPLQSAMSEELLWNLRSVYDGLAQSLPDAAPYVAVIAMNRLAKPWEALKLPVSIARQTNDTLISKTDMGLVGEILFARMETLQNAIHAARHPLFDVDKLIEDARNFAELSSAIVKEIEMRRDGEWGQRLMKDRAAVGGVMAAFMERAPKEVAAALPLQKGNGPKTADFSKACDADKHEMARRYARMVVASRNFAAAASFAAKQKDAFEEICAYLRRYNEDVVKEMRLTDEARRAIVERQFELATELTAILFSDEEAELMRRRGRAAQAAAEAAA